MNIDQIQEIIKRSEQLKLQLKKVVEDPHGEGKILERRWSIGEVAKLVGRKTVSIRHAEERGTLPSPEIHPDKNRRMGYRLEEIINMYEAFRTTPKRVPFQDPLCVLTFQNFKGGVAKSILSSTVAEYLAMHGLRVLLVDCDPQASTTRLVGGYSPDEDLEESDTLLPFFSGEQRNLAYAVRKTHWANLKLIPSNLLLYAAEYTLENRMIRGRMHQGWKLLERGLTEIGDDYDVIVLDPPPALGMISLNVLHAANSIIVPMPPNMVDFYSTLQFYAMLEEVLTTIRQAETGDRAPESVDAEAKSYQFIKVMVTRKRQRRQREDERSEDLIVAMAKKFYEDYMMESILYESEEITAAAAVGRTVLEVDQPVSSRSTHARAVHNIDEIGTEVMRLILDGWPGHQRRNVRQSQIGGAEHG